MILLKSKPNSFNSLFQLQGSIDSCSNQDDKTIITNNKKSDISNFLIKFTSHTAQNNIELKQHIQSCISNVFRQDREVLDSQYLEEVRSKDKYSKLGYVEALFAKETSSSAAKYFKTQNIHVVNQEYSDFYNSSLKSLHRVVAGEKQYSKLFLNAKIGKTSIVDIWLEYLTSQRNNLSDDTKIKLLNQKLRAYSRPDDLIQHTIERFFEDKINSSTQKKNNTPAKVVEYDLDAIKNVFTDITSSNDKKSKFIAILENDDVLEHKINNKKIIDMLLLTLNDNEIQPEQLDNQYKKDALKELAQDEQLLDEMLNDFMRILRKEAVISKLKNTEQKLSQAAEDFSDAEKAQFKRNICTKPFNMRRENVDKAFSIISNYLKTCNKSEYREMFVNLDGFSEALYNNDFQNADTYWDKISHTIFEYWVNDDLQQEVATLNSCNKKLYEFTQSDLYGQINAVTDISLIFKSNVFDIKDKVFLLDKLNEKPQTFAQELCQFLIDKVPSNAIRAQILRNIAESEEFANENFAYLKAIFISDIDNGNVKSEILTKEINNESLINRIIALTPMQHEIRHMSLDNKIDYLKNFPAEELDILLEQSHKGWVHDNVCQAYEDEAAKYDLHNRFSQVMDNITITIDGKKSNFFDVLKEGLQNLYGQNVDIKNISEKTLKEALSNQRLILAHDSNVGKLFVGQNKQLEKITMLLCENSKESKEIHQMLSLALDKMEREQPARKNEIKHAKSFWRTAATLGTAGVAGFRIYASGGTDPYAYTILLQALAGLIS